MHSTKLAVSIASLLACFAGSTVLGAQNPEAPSHKITKTKAVESVPLSSTSTSSNFQEFKLQPRLNVWGSSGDKTLGEAQMLIPMYGDQSKVLYGLVEGNISVNNNGWLAGGGLGYRQVVENERIYGGYALVDYNNTPENNGFWIANPGLEMFGPVWDININGYIPIGSKKTLSQEIWADTFIVNNKPITGFDDAKKYISFQNHTEHAHKFQLGEEAGKGSDFEIGRAIPHLEKAKLYLGAYHFDTNDFGATNGIETRLTYDLNRYTSLEIENTNDNVYHNQILFSIRLTFGGYSEEEKQKLGISSRLLDPIDHDFAILNGSSQVSIIKHYTDKGEYLEHDNLWFFKPSGTTSNQKTVSEADSIHGTGTAEDPFIGFTPETKKAIIANIGKIDQYPLIYFTPGEYSLSEFRNHEGIQGRFDLPNGWGMYGRSADYISPATQDNRPLFKGGLDLNYELNAGNEQTTVDSIHVINNQVTPQSNDYFNAALYANNSKNMVLRNVELKSETSQSNAYGIYATNSIINFSAGVNNISGVSSSGNGYGIYDTSPIIFSGGENKITGSSTTGVAHGIYDVAGITFSGDSTNYVTGYSSSGVAYGIDNSLINFNGGTNNIIGASASGTAYGVYANIKNFSLYFRGGINTIEGNGGTGTGYGIKFDQYSIMQFHLTSSSGKARVTINATGDKGNYAVYSSGFLQFEKENFNGNFFVTFIDCSYFESFKNQFKEYIKILSGKIYTFDRKDNKVVEVTWGKNTW